MVIPIIGTYLDGSGAARAVAQPISIPLRTSATVRMSLLDSAGVPRAHGAAVFTLTAKANPDAFADVLFKATGAANPTAGPNAVDFAVPAAATQSGSAGVYYYDVMAVGLGGSGSRDQVVPASLLRALPVVST